VETKFQEIPIATLTMKEFSTLAVTTGWVRLG